MRRWTLSFKLMLLSGAALVALLLTFFARSVCAFTSTGIQTVSAGCFVGGSPSRQPSPGGTVRIRHKDLLGISGVSKEAIIQGEVGAVLNNFIPSFPNRLTPATPNASSSSNGPIRVRVVYRLLKPGEPPDSASEQPIELPAVYGPDPFGFAFQIPPSSLSSGILQYRIIAERFEDKNGASVVVASVTHPLDDQWVSPGLIAQASQQFGPAGGQFSIPNGNPNVGQTQLNIPVGALSELTTISIDELSPDNPQIPPLGTLGSPVVVYKLDADNPHLNAPMQFAMLYPDFTFPNGQQGQIGAQSLGASSGVPESRASMVWYDGFSWRRLGGKVDANANTVTAPIQFFNYMAIVTAGPLAPEDRRPLEKIITPNGDGKNDSVFFALDSGHVDIFDISGRRVRSLFAATNPEWNGRDDNGKIVESGVYIYQYEADGKRISGLIAVAK